MLCVRAANCACKEQSCCSMAKIARRYSSLLSKVATIKRSTTRTSAPNCSTELIPILLLASSIGQGRHHRQRTKPRQNVGAGRRNERLSVAHTDHTFFYSYNDFKYS